MNKTLPDKLDTERFRLRPLRREDREFFVELHGNRDVVRFLGGDGEPRTPEATADWLAQMIRWYADFSLGPYAIERRDDGSLVGRSGLTIFEVEKQPTAEDGIPVATWGAGSAAPGMKVEPLLELGYVVHPAAQGEGVATEVSRGWQRFAFEVWEEPVVYSVIADGNTPSLKVAAKNGMLPANRSVRMDGKVYGLYRRERASWA